MKNLAKISQHRILFFGIALLASLAVISGGKALAFSGDGDGTGGDPYQITTCNELAEANNDQAAYYFLMNDVDCSGHADFTNSVITSFSGNFDGQTHEISGLTIDHNAANTGLIGQLTGTIRNLSLTDIDFTGATAVGGIAGTMSSGATISNVSTAGTITCTNTCGGIVGSVSGGSAINRASSTVDISGDDSIGGILGFSSAFYSGGYSINVTNVYYNGTLALPDGEGGAGGIAGGISGTRIKNGYAAGTITGGDTVGGIVSSAAGTPSVANMFSAMEFTDTGMRFGPIAGVCTSIDGPNYFDTHITGFSTDPNDCGGQPKTTSSDLYDNTKAPLSSWNFDAVWEEQASDYPTLRMDSHDPVILCESATSTETTIHSFCDIMADVDWGTTTWDVRYQKVGDSDWTYVTLDDATDSHTTVEGLDPGTDYLLQFRFSNDWGTSPWATEEVTTDGVPVGGSGGGSGGGPTTHKTTKRTTKVAQTTGSTYSAPASDDVATATSNTPDSSDTTEISPAAFVTDNNDTVSMVTDSKSITDDKANLFGRLFLGLGIAIVTIALISMIVRLTPTNSS